MTNSNPSAPSMAKSPFYFANVCCLGLAALIWWRNHSTMDFWTLLFFVLCGALGAFFAVLPFLLEYRALLRVNESHSLGDAFEKIQDLEEVASRIATATALWQTVQEQAVKTAGTAKQIADNMAGEAASFADFIKKANDTEKGSLRLEIDKLRRSEGEWLQIVVRMLDHVYALNQAARRSGQRSVIEQLDHFQNACRDTARRVGLLAFAPESGQPFDPQQHQIADPQATAQPGAVVADVVATGYTFQGRLVRPALVNLRGPAAEEAKPAPVEEKPTAEEAPKAAAAPLEEPTLL